VCERGNSLLNLFLNGLMGVYELLSSLQYLKSVVLDVSTASRSVDIMSVLPLRCPFLEYTESTVLFTVPFNPVLPPLLDHRAIYLEYDISRNVHQRLTKWY
jgi:hypothetical protein